MAPNAVNTFVATTPLDHEHPPRAVDAPGSHLDASQTALCQMRASTSAPTSCRLPLGKGVEERVSGCWQKRWQGYRTLVIYTLASPHLLPCQTTLALGRPPASLPAPRRRTTFSVECPATAPSALLRQRTLSMLPLPLPQWNPSRSA
ncbi:hypothetical protein GALMADRAFT_1247144 [Galerina marginata CBS 339.88]|uniref:Uncharacterized protein n=1 Tax=Galerina marginata (strain CBS 339.88) TaxID=685588 RepID=A0A067TBD0_GALM3|nr:hypothetical protein GALMADRAFT_1247144 [Galerina marginata CBS 339.88]